MKTLIKCEKRKDIFVTIPDDVKIDKNNYFDVIDSDSGASLPIVIGRHPDLLLFEGA